IGCDNQNLRVSRRVEITCKACPTCGGTAIVRWTRGKKAAGHPLVKRVYDLVFTRGLIRRKVIECRTARHECQKCGAVFLPQRYTRLAKHFHGLMSWAMYQHVTHRASFNALADMLKEFFALTVTRSELHTFKSQMARYYGETYKKLLA